MPRYALGLDLGGSRLKLVALDDSGSVLDRDTLPSLASTGVAAALQAIGDGVRRVRDRLGDSPGHVGLGLPGIVEPRDGRLAGPTPHLPGAESVAWRSVVEAIAGCPVAVDNDANAATHAELEIGALRGARQGLVVLIGTGVGAGLVVDGAVYRGARGGAGEIGHLPIGSGELACACGVPSCVEPDMSGEGVARAAVARGLPWSDFHDVWNAARGGNAGATALVDRMTDRLGASLAIAVQILDPGVVVLGGGVAEAGDALVDRIRAGFARHAPAVSAQDVRIVRSSLGEHAGAIGAALLASRPRSAGETASGVRWP